MINNEIVLNSGWGEIISKDFNIFYKNLILKAVVQGGEYIGLRVYDGGIFKGYFWFKELNLNGGDK